VPLKGNRESDYAEIKRAVLRSKVALFMQAGQIAEAIKPEWKTQFREAKKRLERRQAAKAIKPE
jgi:hypothetical protein